MSLLASHAATLRDALDRLEELEGPASAAAAAMANSLRNGGKILAAGNGGSAAEAQHFTAELLGRLHPDRERGPLPAIALHADTSTITAVGNDYGYEEIFSRQVAALASPQDTLVVFSTSGRSANLVNAVERAAEIGCTTIGVLGNTPRALHACCDHVLQVPSDSLAAVQECHLVLLHVLVEQAENLLGVVQPTAVTA
jgi:D-sedoheptulose 7-phosphate isomerase